MPSRYPKVSIVIPTCHRATNLRQCLDSISKQTYGNVEVVVVQCEPDQESSNVIANFSQKLSIVQISKSGGLVAQMNAGLEKSSGDIVVRTDDDIVASPNWLSEVVDTFEKRADIGGVTGPTIVPSERLGLR